MGTLTALLFSRAGLIGMAVLVVIGIIGVQTLRLSHAKSDLATARASLATATASLKASEALRGTEYAAATKSLSDAEKACADRVAQAHSSAGKIRTLVERPHATDPTTHCPVRSMLGAGELRNAIQP